MEGFSPRLFQQHFKPSAFFFELLHFAGQGVADRLSFLKKFERIFLNSLAVPPALSGQDIFCRAHAFVGKRDAKHTVVCDTLPFQPQCFDLMISLLEWGWAPHLPKLIQTWKMCLKEKGFLIVALPGERSFNAFQRYFYNLDQAHLSGGFQSRFFPLVQADKLCSVFQSFGFRFLTCDTDLFVRQGTLQENLRLLRKFVPSVMRKMPAKKMLTRQHVSSLSKDKDMPMPLEIEMIFITAST